MTRFDFFLHLHPRVSSRRRLRWLFGLASLPAILAASTADAALLSAELVAREGDVPLGAMLPVATIRPPFALADGTVAFVGLLNDGDGFVFIGDQVVWQGSNEMAFSVVGAELPMGATVGGAFLYSPTVSGSDAVWSHLGLLAVEGAQAPTFPPEVVSTFHSRPSMTPGGVAYWIAGINSSGGSNTEQRVLYRSPTAMLADTEVALAVGDMVGGLAIDAPAGIDFDYQVSDDDTHRIQVLLMDTGSSMNDGHIFVDGTLVHQEDTPNGAGDDWDNFDLVAINNQGTYLFSGDTSGGIAMDEFIAVDGGVAVREGDVIAGITLAPDANVRSIAIDNSGRMTHTWSYEVGGGGTAETVFFACDAQNAAMSSVAVLTAGVDELDFDGDGLADAQVSDLRANNLSNSEGLTDDGFVYLGVELDDGLSVLEAMVRVPVDCCGNQLVDNGEECDDGNQDDSDLCPGTCMAATCGDGFLWTDMEQCDDGNLVETDACLSSCVEATCGDGVIWAGVEECDDGNDDQSDSCPFECVMAQCGDGFLWSGIEECDDGNTDNTDACLSTCVVASCGDGEIYAGEEECDDGNTDDTDACPSSCLMAVCGDGFVQAGVEECDDGNDDDTDGCSAECIIVENPSDSSGGSGGSGGTGGSSGPVGTSSSGGLDDTAGAPDSSGLPVTAAGSSGSEQSTTSSTSTTFGGIDDDGGCNCRLSGPNPRRPGMGMLWGLWVLGAVRRRRRSTDT